MRVWLAGSRTFGATVFREINGLDGVRVVAITAPHDDILHQVADGTVDRQGTEVAGPEVAELRTDVIVSAQNYAHIDSATRLAAKSGAIGYHPSLLPRHRGRSAVEWTIEMGDSIAGGTVYKMDDGWDSGPIILQEFCHVLPGWTASDLWRERLFSMGVKLLSQALRQLRDRGSWDLCLQDEAAATYESEILQAHAS